MERFDIGPLDPWKDAKPHVVDSEQEKIWQTIIADTNRRAMFAAMWQYAMLPIGAAMIIAALVILFTSEICDANSQKGYRIGSVLIQGC